MNLASIPLPLLSVAGAALLFGASTRFAKQLSGSIAPVMLAGLLYAGSGVGLAALRLARDRGWRGSRMSAREWPQLLAAIAFGGIAGTARTAAYFSTAPFVGAVIAVTAFRESVEPLFWPAAALMAAGVYLHLSERHAHFHSHSAMRHDHRHVHDAHHRHEHDFPWDGREPRAHTHRHEAIAHSHARYPDIHHRHAHRSDPAGAAGRASWR